MSNQNTAQIDQHLNMKKEEILRILQKKQEKKTLLPEEELLLESFYLHLGQKSDGLLSENELQANLDHIGKVLQQQIAVRRRNQQRIWYSMAAMLAIVVSISLYFLSPDRAEMENTRTQAVYFKSVAPGFDQAVLHLANGEKVFLDSTDKLLYDQDKLYTAGKVIDLNSRGVGDSADHILRVPQGGQYKVVLADGTMVWLNAGSELKYPVKFAQNSRAVELQGEAYFEVSHNPNKPFKVYTQDQIVHVLGTGFNVSAYSNESTTRTTLVHGKVRITQPANPDTDRVLRPGEQLTVSRDGMRQEQTDIAREISWKAGLFNFHRSDLISVTRQLERWYNVQFTFANRDIPQQLITGNIPRNTTLAEVLDILARFGIKATWDGQTILLNEIN